MIFPYSVFVDIDYINHQNNQIISSQKVLVGKAQTYQEAKDILNDSKYSVYEKHTGYSGEHLKYETKTGRPIEYSALNVDGIPVKESIKSFEIVSNL